MSPAQDLQKLKQYGEDILQALPAEPPAPLATLHQKTADAARRLVSRANSPVKIGVVGEFSSGKTLLLNSLIGCGDALPATP